jgi:hypothetical protein
MIRPLNSKAKTILKVAIPLAVVTFVLFLWPSARPVSIQVRVTFTGFTNPPTPPLTLATFCMSNAGTCSVFLEPVRYIEIKNKPPNVWVSYAMWGELKPGEFKTISRFPPNELQREPSMRVDARGSLVRQTNLEPWRLSLSFFKADWRQKLVRNPTPPSVLRKVRQLVPAKWLERHPIEVHSDWINGPPELMPVASNTTNTSPK